MGAERWLLMGGVFVVAVGVWATVRLFVRRLPRFSGTVTVAILVGYAAMPAVVPLMQLAVDDDVTPLGPGVVGWFGFVLFSAAVFVVALLATTYGFGTLLRRALRHTVYDLRSSVHLLGRALCVRCH